MKPRKQTIASLRENAEYKYVAGHSVDVYPGWAEMHVFEHIETGRLYGTMVYMSDDSGDGADPKEWSAVKAIIKTRYEFVTEAP